MEKLKDSNSLLAEADRLRQENAALKRKNKELLVNKQQLDAIMDNAPVELYLKDREGRYLKINKQFEKIFGVKNDDIVGLLPSDVHDPKLAESTRLHDLTVLNGKVTERREEQAKLVIDQKIHTLLTIKFPVLNDQKEVDGLGAIVTDITEHVELEETLRRVQKMDAIGQLVGGIAHDFNNILGIVMGNLELAENGLENNTKPMSHVRSAYKSAQRGAELTRRLLGFSRTHGGKAEQVDINRFLLDNDALISKSLTAPIHTELQLEPQIWAVKIDLGELEDALLNISINARDAMPNGGRLIIQTKNVVLSESSSDPEFEAGEYVELSLTDNGLGMSDEICKRAIEPFFTTKSSNNGIGLGLSMVYGFIRRCGGHINLESEINVGTKISLYLPRSVDDSNTVSHPNEQLQHLRGTETVLVVDDEIDMADVAIAYLEDLGYKTLVAHNADQAFDILNSVAKIDLLFADVIMPGSLDGNELAVAAKNMYPELKVLLTSGYTKKRDVDEVADDTSLFFNLLQKPYNKSVLSIALRQLLDD